MTTPDHTPSEPAERRPVAIMGLGATVETSQTGRT